MWPLNSLSTGKSRIGSRSTSSGVIATQKVLRIIRSMFSDFVCRSASSLGSARLNTLATNGSRGAPLQMPAFHGQTQKRFDACKAWRQVAALSLLWVVFSDGRAQSLPTVAVERDGDTFL